MHILKTGLAASLLAITLAAAPAFAHPPIGERAAEEEKSAFEADRADILAMAGDYKVRFDMQETTPWAADYTPLDRKISGGHESVRIIEDTGRKIILQHLLVVKYEGKTHIIKHWRQDWEYEPEKTLVYSGANSWEWENVPEKMRKGRWSQTVSQVDDSPRYAGWGLWETQGGVRRWRSNWTWRPLARRDAVRGPVYDRYYAINRHQPTPNGWIHWQDNIKMAAVDGKMMPIVQEYVLNTYSRFNDYPTSAADEYWAATKAYWAIVRNEWDQVANRNGGIHIQEQADTGTVISAQLLEMGTAIFEGTMTQSAAISEARRLIQDNT